MQTFTCLLTLSLSLTFTSVFLPAQGTAINETGAPPDSSAILDVQSISKGVLIPRMTTAQRLGIANPADGLLVFDAGTGSFWFKTGSEWIELTDNFHGLRDADHDTQVQVEESPDEDIIRFDIAGTEAMVLTESTQGATRLDISPDQSLIIGHDAGLTTISGWNTFIGYEAGRNNTTGDRNVFLGFRAGQNNGPLRDRNVLIGYEAGINNNAGFNTMLGCQAGHTNTTGYSNTFAGYLAGVQNTTGYRNTFIGQQAGHDNEEGFENTFIGHNAGYFNTGSYNTFLGESAGRVNRTGLYNTIVGAQATGNSLNNRNLGNGNAIFGYQAGYQADSLWENTFMGYQAGYNISIGSGNVYLGYQTGMLSSVNHANVGVGINALRENRSGNYNVAVGDSSLMNNIASGNVAVGTKAGMGNLNGTGNTFIGNKAGTNNTTADLNTFVGWRSGNYNTLGGYNVAIGAETANANSEGNGNTFIGYAAGFRNSVGNENVFAGHSAGEYNIDGSSNIGIGLWACTRNAFGSNNIAIGEYALGDPVGGQATLSDNIAIGYQAGQNANGNNNIIIGNSSGVGVDGEGNIMVGHNIVPLGNNNTFLGTNASASLLDVPFNATAIGYGAQISQNFSIILGDASENQAKVGIGTMKPAAKLHVDNNGFQEIFRVANSGSNVFRVLDNLDVVVHHELLVNTTTGKSGYKVSVDGGIACEEVLVQDSGAWPDYVFADDYSLRSIQDVQRYIRENHHLPGIPSAKEVSENGVKIGEIQRKLLEKVEELTLYIIELESRITSLESK